MPAAPAMRTSCPVCDAPGEWLYRDLADRLFGAEGAWSLRRCSSPACGLIWLDPPPSSGQLAAAYRDYPTHQDPPQRNTAVHRIFRAAIRGYRANRFRYAPEPVTSGDRLLGALVGAVPPLREYMDVPFSFFPGLPGGRLLEFGCGAGATLQCLGRWGWDAEGVDFDAAAVANAAAKGLNVHHGDIFSRGYPDASFDVVFSSHVLEHVTDPVATLRECRRILKPGGRCLVVTPNTGSLGHRFFGPNWRGLEPPRHLHLFSAASLGLAARNAGFVRLELGTRCRGAAGAFIDSLRVRAHRDVFEPIPVGLRLTAELAHVLTMLFHVFDPRCGEELVFEGYA